MSSLLKPNQDFLKENFSPKKKRQFSDLSNFSLLTLTEAEKISPPIKANNFKKKSDRYIPNRKSSKLNLVLSNANDSMNIENNNEQQQITTVSELFKSKILNLSKKKTSKNSPQSFINGNFLKFNEEILSSSKNSYLIPPSNITFQASPNKSKEKIRNIPQMPYKILDAPNLQDDFYLNLVDWSSKDILAVGLNSTAYLFAVTNNKVNRLCNLNEQLTSLCWQPNGNLLAIGTNSGELQIWDINNLKKIQSIINHEARVSSIAWSSEILCTGSRDKSLNFIDPRCKNIIKSYKEHRQEICGLKWSSDNNELASGGNDNKLFIWNLHSNSPVRRFTKHKAAVKAIAWSPHQHGLIASGGGTADRTIRFWNTLENSQVNCIESESQVCNLMFSKNSNEIVSTHGFSMNEINVWNYPNMRKIASLTGHFSRVLYLAMSPNGENIVTGAGDETLRFWNTFPKKDNKGCYKGGSVLNGNALEIR